MKLAWTGGLNRRSVAELTLMFAIALLHRVPQCAHELRGGHWSPLVGRQLSGRTVGIVGCGHVGKDLVGLLEPFGCRLLAHDIRDYAEFYEANGVQPVSLLELLRESEVVTLHVPLDATTRGMIGAREIAQMRPGAVLINAARGGIVDEAALREALVSGHLSGAAFDVFGEEPPSDRSLLELPVFLGTPHIGGSTEEAQLAMGRAAIEGLETARLVEMDGLNKGAKGARCQGAKGWCSAKRMRRTALSERRRPARRSSSTDALERRRVECWLYADFDYGWRRVHRVTSRGGLARRRSRGVRSG